MTIPNQLSMNDQYEGLYSYRVAPSRTLKGVNILDSCTVFLGASTPLSFCLFTIGPSRPLISVEGITHSERLRSGNKALNLGLFDSVLRDVKKSFSFGKL